MIVADLDVEERPEGHRRRKAEDLGEEGGRLAPVAPCTMVC
jgi:hypothetical protein